MRIRSTYPQTWSLSYQQGMYISFPARVVRNALFPTHPLCHRATARRVVFQLSACWLVSTEERASEDVAALISVKGYS
jgi:hypothetical protein